MGFPVMRYLIPFKGLREIVPVDWRWVTGASQHIVVVNLYKSVAISKHFRRDAAEPLAAVAASPLVGQRPAIWIQLSACCIQKATLRLSRRRRNAHIDHCAGTFDERPGKMLYCIQADAEREPRLAGKPRGRRMAHTKCAIQTPQRNCT